MKREGKEERREGKSEAKETQEREREGIFQNKSSRKGKNFKAAPSSVLGFLLTVYSFSSNYYINYSITGFKKGRLQGARQ